MDSIYYAEDGTTELICDASDSAIRYALSDGKLEVRVQKDLMNMGNSKKINYSVIFRESGSEWNEAKIAGGVFMTYKMMTR